MSRVNGGNKYEECPPNADAMVESIRANSMSDASFSGNSEAPMIYKESTVMSSDEDEREVYKQLVHRMIEKMPAARLQKIFERWVVGPNLERGSLHEREDHMELHVRRTI